MQYQAKFEDMNTMKIIPRLFLIVLMANSWAGYGQSARQCYKVSKEFIEKGNLQDALTQLNKAVEIDPKYVDAYVARAGVLEKMDKIQDALDDYNRAIIFDPKDEDSYYEAGRLNFLLKKYDEAIKQLDRALDLKKGYIEAFPYKIRCLIALHKLNEAAAVCEIALNFKENAVHLYLTGQVNELQKKYEDAEYNYSRAIKKNAKYTEAWLAQANLQIFLRKPDKAIESVNSALKLEPNNVPAYILRSRADTLKLDFPNAINDVSKAILINPNNEELFMLRGEYYQKFTQYQSAINDFSKVLVINKGNAKALYSRAAAFEQIANYKAAVKDYENLIRLSDQDAEAKKMLSNAKDRLFELNRESNPPQLFLTTPEIIEKSLVQLPKGKNDITLKGRITDESDLKYLKINDRNVPFVKNDDGNAFIADIELGGKDEFSVIVSDVYDNAIETKFRIIRTETDPPTIYLLAPYASDNGQIYLDNIDPTLYVEGNLKDESKIRSILIDGVSASYKMDDLNPGYSAKINIKNKNKFTVTATDIYGNQSEKTFMINREGVDSLGENFMGKTWVVFIENANYKTFASLEGPTKDVMLMKSALAKYRINNIIHKKDMGKEDMEKFFTIELRDLLRVNGVNTVLIWYAGHGKFINQTGYWIPIDARRDDEFTYFNIGTIKSAMQAYSNITHTLVVTDACESGPTFYQAMRGDRERNCRDKSTLKLKSSQVFSSAGYELAVDNSQFTKTFANILANNADACLPIESIVNKVTNAVKQNNQQVPKFGKIAGLEDQDGTFFFLTKQ
jgi:tetratricopeptide (TPR) repeat protein